MAFRSLNGDDLLRIREAVEGGDGLVQAFAKARGGTLDSGVWRVFGRDVPGGGIESWNGPSRWREEWGQKVDGIALVGEDVFGNQLGALGHSSSALLWDHESGEVFDLLVDPVTLFETALESGVEWIDYYADSRLAVARARLGDVPDNAHLHWTTPLILGGSVDVANTSVVGRDAHLLGHAQLFRQIEGLPPGATIAARR